MKPSFCVTFALAMASTTAHAAVALPSPIVTESVTRAANGTFDYQFSILEPKFGIYPGNLTEIDLPWFADAALTSPINAPAGWGVDIVNAPFGGFPSGSLTLVLRAPGTGVPEGVSTGVFSYSSSYAPAKAPYLAKFDFFNLYGDPSIPGSPEAIAAGLQPTALPPVPEPEAASMLLMGLGLLGLLAARAKRGD